MKVTCEFCNGYYDETQETCPSCGAPNPHLKRVSSDTPTTIEELKEWYANSNLPPEDVTRFFIGRNFTGAKAYGIYKNETSGKFIVYKNKSDGSRVIHYEGYDELYAVNEIYMKIKETMLSQKEHASYHSTEDDEEAKRRRAQAEAQRIAYMNMENKSFFRRFGIRKIIIAFVIIQFVFELLVFSGVSCVNCTSFGMFSPVFHQVLNNSDSAYTETYHYYNNILNDDPDDDDDWWDSSDDSSSSSWDSDWDSDWDSSWDSSWDSDWGTDWDSDW